MIAAANNTRENRMTIIFLFAMVCYFLVLGFSLVGAIILDGRLQFASLMLLVIMLFIPVIGGVVNDIEFKHRFNEIECSK